jgi:hypothetical protein
MAERKRTSTGAPMLSLEQEREQLARERAQLEADMLFFRSLKPKPSNLVMRRDGVYEAPPPARRRSFFDIPFESDEDMSPSVPGRRGAII